MKSKKFTLCFLIFGFQIAFLESSGSSVVTSVWTTVGAKVSLPCPFTPSLEGDRTVLVLWFKDSSTESVYSYDGRVGERPSGTSQRWADQTVFGHRSFFTIKSHPPTLVLNPSEKDDQGQYTCRVEYLRSPSTFNKVNLSVIIPPDPPLILWKGREIMGRIGPIREAEKVSLVCQTKGGRPTPLVTWWREGAKIESITEAKVAFGSTVVQSTTIFQAHRSDHGSQFVCHAQAPNPGHALSEPRSVSATLDIILPPLSVKITGLNNPIVAGSTVKPVCLSTGSHPLAEIEWFKDGQKIKENNKSVLNGGNVTSSSVTLHTTRDDHKSTLLCTAFNPSMVGEERNIYTLLDKITLHVLYKPSVELILGKVLNATNLIEGEDAFLECVFEANPPPHRIEWFHNNLAINNEEGLIVSGSSLAMQRLQKNHAGSYRCSAENLEGKTFSNFLEVKIKYAPICASTKERTQGAAIGQSTKVLCRVESDPDKNLTFGWSKILPSGRELQLPFENVTIKDKTSFLTFTPLHLGDFGHFLCRARNSIGEQKKPCKVTIVSAGPPEIPHNCSAIPGSESLTVACREGFHGGFPQRFQLVAFQRKIPIFNQTSEFPSWTITGLEDGTELKMHIRSVNAKGQSDVIILDAHMPIAHQQSVIIPELSQDNIGPLLGAVLGVVIVVIILFIGAVTTVCRRRRVALGARHERNKSDSNSSDSRRRSQGTGASESSPDVVNSVQYRSSSSPIVDVLDNSRLDEAASIDELVQSRMNSRSTDRTSDSAYYEEDGDYSVKTIYLASPSPKPASHTFYAKLYNAPNHHYSSPYLEPGSLSGEDPDQISKDYQDDRLSSYENLSEPVYSGQQKPKVLTPKSKRKHLYYPFEKVDEAPPIVTRSSSALARPVTESEISYEPLSSLKKHLNSSKKNRGLSTSNISPSSEVSKLLVDGLNASIEANMKLVAELTAASETKLLLQKSIPNNRLQITMSNQKEKSKGNKVDEDVKEKNVLESVTVPNSADYRESTV